MFACWSIAVLTQMRGGGVALRALLLALLCITSSLWGCRKADIMTAGRQTVQIETLLPLHPAWAQVESLDRTITAFRAQPSLSGRAGSDLPRLPLAFSPPNDTSGVLPRQRQLRALQSAEEYVRQLGEILRRQNDAALTRLARREAQGAQSAYQKELVERETAIRSARLQQAAELDRQITRLKFRDVAFQTQLIYKGQAKQDALQQHQALLDQIKTLMQKGDALLQQSAINTEAMTVLEPRLKELRRLADQNLEKERQALADRLMERLAQEKSKLTVETEPLPPINATPLPAPDSRETPLVLPPGVQANAAFASATTTLQKQTTQQETVWQAQREHLVNVIREDTQQALTQVAKREGWTLAPWGTRGAQDKTEAAKPLLRQQWLQGRTE